MTIESKWDGSPKDTQPNENVLASSLPSVKSQIQQWSKMQGISDKPTSPTESHSQASISKATHTQAPRSEFTKISPNSTSANVQKSWVKFGTPAETPSQSSPFPGKTFNKAPNTTASFISNAEPVTSSLPSKPSLEHTTVVPIGERSVPIPIKSQKNPSANANQASFPEEPTEPEEGKKVPGRISSPFIDADSVLISGFKETISPKSVSAQLTPTSTKKVFSDSTPAGHNVTSTNSVANRVTHPGLALTQTTPVRNQSFEEVTSVSDPFSDEQAVFDTSRPEVNLTTRTSASPESSVQVPPRPSSKTKPIPISSKSSYPVASFVSRSPTSNEHKYKLESSQPAQIIDRPIAPRRSVPEESFLSNIESDGVKTPPRPAHTVPAHSEVNIEELRIKESPYSTAQSNSHEREYKPTVPYRSNSVLTRRPGTSNESSGLNIKPAVPSRANVTPQQDISTNDPYNMEEMNPYIHRSKTVSGKGAPRLNIPYHDIQQNSTQSSRSILNPPVPTGFETGNPDIANRVPVIPRPSVSIPGNEYEQKPALPHRPLPDSHLSKPTLPARAPNFSRMNSPVASEGRLDIFVSDVPDAPGRSSAGVAPPVLPPKPALPQKWVNSNFGQYDTPDSNVPSDPSEFAPPARQNTNTTDSDSNSDDGGTIVQQPLFPDQTYANRKAPVLPNRTVRLQHKNAPKRFSIAGYVVITGHVAVKIWNMNSEESSTVCHEDGRVSAITSCPAADTREGRLFWCGLLDGTLIEINTETRKVTNRISSAHSSPVTHILRYKFQLWTIDDSGIVKIWAPDTNKELSFFRKPTTVYIAKKQQVAIVARNELWTAREKNIYVYEYRENQTSPTLEQIIALDVGTEIGFVTCLTKNRDGTIVYTGHMDGKVMIWDTVSHNCVRVVPVSNYRICSLLCVREKYLWAGFATGRIYIYDMSYDHWIVVKSWDAHHSSPVNQIKLNTSSIFLEKEVQIASFAEDGGVKIWDGMLTSDWKEKEMLQRDAEFCTFRDIKVLICSWNIDARKPQKFENKDLQALEAWLSTVKDPEIIVVGFQETVDLESKKVTAKSILKFKNKKSSGEEQWTHRYKQWQEKLTEAIARAGHQSQYELLQCDNLIGLFTCIFVKASEKPKIQCVVAGKVKTGFGGLHGNKGAIAVRFLYEHSSLCFVNCHLAAGQSHVLQRNNDVATILQTSMFPAIEGDNFVFVKGGNGTLVTDHGFCFWSGDLNYRIDLPREEVVKSIQEQKWDMLYEYDQLHREQSENLAFMLRSFTEGPIQFAPTYKYDRDTQIYDTSEKERIPAWCDRVLYRGERIQQHSYQRHELTNSDHRPISAVFTATIKTVITDQHVQRVRNEVEAAWTQYIDKINHRSKENWLIECGYPREIVQQVLESDHDLGRVANYLNSQFP